MSALPELSERDKAILNSIFNPSLPLGEGVFDNEIFQDATDEVVEETAEEIKAKKLEIVAINLAENKKFDESHKIFQKLIDELPLRGTTYNNRAQVYQFTGNIEASLEDLKRAIELSEGKGRTGCQAFCQRGMIYRKQGKDQLAKQDFEDAAKLGSAFAKQQLVEMNPYAALCNQMLKQVIHKLN